MDRIDNGQYLSRQCLTIPTVHTTLFKPKILSDEERVAEYETLNRKRRRKRKFQSLRVFNLQGDFYIHFIPVQENQISLKIAYSLNRKAKLLNIDVQFRSAVIDDNSTKRAIIFIPKMTIENGKS